MATPTAWSAFTQEEASRIFAHVGQVRASCPAVKRVALTYQVSYSTEKALMESGYTVSTGFRDNGCFGETAITVISWS